MSDEIYFKQLEKKAIDDNDADAQYELGLAYDEGPLCEAERRKWPLSSSFETRTGTMVPGGVAREYRMGPLGEVASSDEEAARWYWMAVEQKHPKALYRYGLLHSAGRGVEKSPKEAKRYIRWAAELGDAEAQKWIEEFEARQAAK